MYNSSVSNTVYFVIVILKSARLAALLSEIGTPKGLGSLYFYFAFIGVDGSFHHEKRHHYEWGLNKYDPFSPLEIKTQNYFFVIQYH